MRIINIPSKINKLAFVYNLLFKLLDEFKEYDFFNSTKSPISELSYTEHNGLFYRKIQKIDIIKLIDESNYINSYKADGLDKQGYTLMEYISFCLLFELEEIIVVDKNITDDVFTSINEQESLVTLLICPDGLDEIHIIGEKDFLNVIVSKIDSLIVFCT